METDKTKDEIIRELTYATINLTNENTKIATRWIEWALQDLKLYKPK